MIAIPYDTFEEAMDIAYENLDYEGKGHTCAIHSNDMEHVRMVGEHMPVSRIVVNQPSSTTAGGALTNGFSPTTTLGCGSWGNNSISENLNYTHLINVCLLYTSAQELSGSEKASTPLQEKLNKLGKLITMLGAIAAATVFAIQVVIFLMNGTASLDTVSNAFITSIVLIVAAVPEGLPTIVAVSLAQMCIRDRSRE